MTTEMSYNETVDDVLADMLLPRFDAITAMRANNYDEIKSLVANYRDRLKAAHKRERGDAAKLREVCEKMLDLLTAEGFEDGGMSIELDEKQVIMWRNRFRAALSAPPRNCDMGTAEEQADMRKEATSER